MTAPRYVLARRQVVVGTGELVDKRLDQAPDGALSVAFEAVIVRAGEVMGRWPLFDVPAEKRRERSQPFMLARYGALLTARWWREWEDAA